MDKESGFKLKSIGHVCHDEEGICLKIYDEFRPALKNLEYFSHISVLWWIEDFDNESDRSIMQTNPPYAEHTTMGVFATRSGYRPNPIGLTVCEIEEVDEDEGIVRIVNIDTYDGTPVIDIKAYFPVCDRVEYVELPPWLRGWPEWFPEEGIGLDD